MATAARGEITESTQAALTPGQESPGELDRLRQELLELIAPHTTTAKKPPFSAAELVVIAAVAWGDATDQFSILNAILQNFPYYGRQAIDHYVCTQTPFDEDDDVPRPPQVIDGYVEAFRRYDLPFIARDDGEENTIVPRRPDEEAQKIEVLPRAARLFVGRWLEKRRKGAFPFFKLPAELRNAIYEMVFTLPEEGIVAVDMERDTPAHELRLYAVRRQEDTFDPEELDAYIFDSSWESCILEVDAEAQHLRFLQTCKQIHEEALPFFYNLNRFFCVDIRGTLAFLQRLSPGRMRHIRNIRLDLTDVEHSESTLYNLPALMDKFAGAARLKTLEIVVNGGDWIGMVKHRRRKLGRLQPIKHYWQVPGFRTLPELCSKAEETTFLGDCETVEEWVRKEVEIIRSRNAVLKRQCAGQVKKRVWEGEQSGTVGSKKAIKA